MSAQDFSSHRRWHPIWHFFVVPVVLGNCLVQGRHLIRAQNAGTAWQLVVAVALLLAVFAARIQTLIVQDRLIRLEMRLRLKHVLPEALRGRTMDLTPAQLVGLRFASDAELPALVERCLKGELTAKDQIKKEVKDWQPDFLRA